MKADHKGMKPIAKELGRYAKEIKARWEQIDPDGANAGAAKKHDGGGKKDDKTKDKAKDGGEKKADKQAKADKGGKDQKKAPSKAGSVRSDGQARFTMNEWMTLQEDDLFSFGELQCLSELIMRDDNQRWLRIASRFADKTGRRVHPEDIREKFEEMASMG